MKFSITLPVFFILFQIACISAIAQQYEVKGAGTPEINGIYKASGKVNGKYRYIKGEFIIFYKGCEAKWMIKGPAGNYYRNFNNTSLPPANGWEKGCAKGSLNPAPTLIPVNSSSKVINITPASGQSGKL